MMGSCELSSVFLSAVALEVAATVTSLKVAAQLVSEGDTNLVVARSRGLVVLAESGTVLLSATAVAKHPGSKDTWRIAFAFMLAHWLLNFEMWFSRKGLANLTRGKMLLFGGVVLHFCHLGFLAQFFFPDCIPTAASAIVAGVCVAGGLIAVGPFSAPSSSLSQGGGISETKSKPSKQSHEDSTKKEHEKTPLRNGEGVPKQPSPVVTEQKAEEQESKKPTSTSDEGGPVSPSSQSALRENIAKKGENSYYFAHAKTPTSENINKGESPVKLKQSRRDSIPEDSRPTTALVTVRKYAFSDGNKSVSVYIDLTVLELKQDEVKHQIEFSESSVQVLINDSHVFKVAKLKHEIISASAKVNSSGERLTISLKKKDVAQKWESLS